MSTRRRPGLDRQVRYGRLLGLLFVVAGFVVIFLGWNGMAKVACVDCQLPYLLSGGAAGLGLVLFGSALVVMAGNRAERMAADERFEELIRATGRVGAALATTAGESANGLVVAGRSTYHRPDCRLVKDKDLEKVTVEAAAETGLSACRVCSPAAREQTDAGEKPGKKTGTKKKKS